MLIETLRDADGRAIAIMRTALSVLHNQTFELALRGEERVFGCCREGAEQLARRLAAGERGATCCDGACAAGPRFGAAGAAMSYADVDAAASRFAAAHLAFTIKGHTDLAGVAEQWWNAAEARLARMAAAPHARWPR